MLLSIFKGFVFYSIRRNLKNLWCEEKLALPMLQRKIIKRKKSIFFLNKLILFPVDRKIWTSWFVFSSGYCFLVVLHSFATENRVSRRILNMITSQNDNIWWYQYAFVQALIMFKGFLLLSYWIFLKRNYFFRGGRIPDRKNHYLNNSHHKNSTAKSLTEAVSPLQTKGNSKKRTALDDYWFRI